MARDVHQANDEIPERSVEESSSLSDRDSRARGGQYPADLNPQQEASAATDTNGRGPSARRYANQHPGAQQS